MSAIVTSGLQTHRFGGAAKLILVHAVLAAGAVVMLLPFAWMFLTSIRPPDEILSSSLNPIPGTFYGVENYSDALSTAPLLLFMLNGVIVCGERILGQMREIGHFTYPCNAFIRYQANQRMLTDKARLPRDADDIQ